MSDDLITALDHGLNGLALGEDAAAICARYPHLSVDLRPLLDVARLAQQHGTRQVPAGAQHTSRARFLAQAAELRQQDDRSRPVPAGVLGVLREVRRLPGRLAAHRAVALVLALALVFVLGGYGALAASAQSLPGEPLYGLKRTVEQTQLLLSPDDRARAELEQRFDERRVDEAQRVAASTRTVPLEFGGQLESQAGERWSVAGITVIVRPDTPVAGTPVPGLFVQVQGTSQPDGSVLAARVDVTGVVFRGRVRSSGAAWQIDDNVVQISDATGIVGAPRLGDQVEVNARRLPGGLLLALKISLVERGLAATPTATSTPGKPAEPVEVRLVGVVEVIGAQSWQIGGQVVYVTAATEIEGQPQIGQTVEVRALQAADGTLTARRIGARENHEAASSTPGSGGQGTGPSATNTPKPDSDDHDDKTPTPSLTPGSGGQGTGPSASNTPSPDSDDHDDKTPTPSLTPDGGGSGPSATNTPRPSDTPQSSDAPSEVRFDGTLQAITDDVWVIDGQNVRVTDHTELGDRPQVGDRVEVRALRQDDGSLVATRIDKK